MLFEGVTDPRRSNATRHSLHEMLMIALLSVLCGGEGCADMERYGRAKELFLRRFMVLKHGIPSQPFRTCSTRSIQAACRRCCCGF